MKRTGLPVMAIAGECPLPGVANIHYDVHGGMHALGEHLLAAGHRNIAYYQVFTDSVHNSGVEGLRAAMAGIPGTSLCIRPAVSQQQAVEKDGAYHRMGLTERHPDEQGIEEQPTAFIFDDVAGGLAAVRELRDQGLSVPEDRSIAVLGDNAAAVLALPSLTTLYTPAKEAGLRAGELFIDIIKDAASADTRVKIPLTLNVRESVKSIRQA
jgi:LacI family repressor for deo operon, udp, cdd, tsx, nupC, and nupG